MSTGSAHLYHTTNTSSAREVQHCFPTEVQYKGTLILHLFCSTSSTLPLLQQHSQLLQCNRRVYFLQHLSLLNCKGKRVRVHFTFMRCALQEYTSNALVPPLGRHSLHTRPPCDTRLYLKISSFIFQEVQEASL